MKIELCNVSKSFEGKKVLSGISFNIGKESVALMGASGSGKTTLLRIIAGLEKADEGKAVINGKIAFCFAEPRLFENISVLENVTSVMTGKKSVCDEAARAILSEMGLSNALSLYPSELSTGMAQRVSLARAVAYNGDIYLLDEPLRGLDKDTKESVTVYLKKFLYNKCAVIVTHSQTEAKELTGKTYYIENGKLL